MKAHFSAVLLCLLATLLPVFSGIAAQPVTIHSKWTVGPMPGDSEETKKVILMVYARDRRGDDEHGGAFNPGHPGATDQKFWRLVATDMKGKSEDVKYKLVAKTSSTTGKLAFLLLYPEKQPSPERTYHVEPARGRSLHGLIVAPFVATNLHELAKENADNTNLAADIRYVDGNKALEPQISFKTGKAGTAELKLFYGYEGWKQENKARFAASLDAEATYKPKDEHKYLSRIEGELDLLFLFTDIPRNSRFFHALWETGINARIETDQAFDEVNQTFGWTNFIAFNGEAVQWFGRTFSINAPENYSAPSPLLTLSYELVAKMNDGPDRNRRDLETTTSRVRAHLYLSHRLIHDWDLERVWSKLPRTNVDLVIDSGISYDFRNGEAAPDINVALEFSPVSLDKSKPSLTISYINGKTKADFQNYSALLAGIKIPF